MQRRRREALCLRPFVTAVDAPVSRFHSAVMIRRQLQDIWLTSPSTYSDASGAMLSLAVTFDEMRIQIRKIFVRVRECFVSDLGLCTGHALLVYVNVVVAVVRRSVVCMHFFCGV